MAEAYGADGIDPDSIPHSNKFVMMAMNELQYFQDLPNRHGQVGVHQYYYWLIRK